MSESRPTPDPLVKRCCPLCGSSRAASFLEKASVRLVQCRDCQMVFAGLVNRDLTTGQYYDEQSYYLAAPKLEGDFSVVRFRRELSALRRHCPRGSLLDVGCSSGGFLHALKSRWPGDYSMLGVDVSGPALEFAQSQGLPVLQADFPHHDFAGATFDVVTFWAVLEHLDQPRRFLDKACEVLKPGGFCFVVVPNLRSLAVRLLAARYRYILPEHLNYFTRRTLQRMVSERFAIVECRTTHFNPVVIWQDWREPKSDRSGVERAELLRRTTAWKQSRSMAPLRLLYSATEAALGKAGLADNLLLVAQKRSGPGGAR